MGEQRGKNLIQDQQAFPRGWLSHIEARHSCQEQKEETVSLLETAITLMNLLRPQDRCLVWGLIKASAAALE